MNKRNMPPVHPGNILKEMYLDPLGITVTDFANNIDVARRTVSLIINEHSGISAEMALRLGKAFGTTPEMWLDMQQKYDLWMATQRVELNDIKNLAKAASSPWKVAARTAHVVAKGSHITSRKSTPVKTAALKTMPASKH